LSKEEVELKNVFSTGVKKLRDYETMLVQQDDLYFIKMHKKVQEIVYSISKEIKNKRG
jgi:hypothetical protein